MDFPLNFAAVIAATIATFIVGFIWYTPLFGKAWAREHGFDTSVKPTSAELGKGMGLNLIGNFLLSYVFAHNMGAWTFVPGMEKMGLAGTILNSAIFTWLGFFVPVELNSVAWEKKSWKLFFINTGYHLVMLLVAATILAVWR